MLSIHSSSGQLAPAMYTEVLPGDQALALLIPSLTEGMAGMYYCSASYANTEQMEIGVRIETYGKFRTRNHFDEAVFFSVPGNFQLLVTFQREFLSAEMLANVLTKWPDCGIVGTFEFPFGHSIDRLLANFSSSSC